MRSSTSLPADVRSARLEVTESGRNAPTADASAADCRLLAQATIRRVTCLVPCDADLRVPWRAVMLDVREVAVRRRHELRSVAIAIRQSADRGRIHSRLRAVAPHCAATKTRQARPQTPEPASAPSKAMWPREDGRSRWGLRRECARTHWIRPLSACRSRHHTKSQR